MLYLELSQFHIIVSLKELTNQERDKELQALFTSNFSFQLKKFILSGSYLL